MPRSRTVTLFLSESAPDVPLVAVVASIRVEFGPLQGPGQLRGLGGLVFCSVRALGRAVALEVRRQWNRGFAAHRALGRSLLHAHQRYRCVDIVDVVSTESATRTIVETTTQLDDGDHERFTHIVLEGFHPKDETKEFVPVGNSVVEGMINSTPVRALCGKVWVPGRDPKKYPLCPTCRELAEKMGWTLPPG